MYLGHNPNLDKAAKDGVATLTARLRRMLGNGNTSSRVDSARVMTRVLYRMEAAVCMRLSLSRYRCR